MFSRNLPVKLFYLVLSGMWLVSTACSEPRRDAPPQSHPALTNVPAAVADPDTLRVEDDFANAPFLLDSITFTGVQKLMGTNVQIKKEPTRNNFVPGQIDTLITLRKSGSYITLYAVSAEDSKYFFKEAAIKDPLPIFQHQLKIGQHKAQVTRLLPALKGKNYLPDNVEIVAGEGTDYLYLIFKNDILQRVDYKPYLD